MKLGSIVAASLITAVSYGQAVVLTGSGGYGWDSPYNKLYNRNRQIVFSGRVSGKVKASPMPGMAEGVSLLVKTTKSGTMQVDVGPSWFVASQVAKINVGDRVKVIGSKATINGDPVVLARQIVNLKTTRVLALRDLAGVPYWTAYRNTVAQVPADAVAGTILSTDTVNIDGSNLVGYVVQTPNGNVNVVTAPQWFMDRQDYVLSPGSYVQIVGTRVPYSGGTYVTVADSVYSGNNTLVFRNAGIPIWNGWGGR